MAIASASLPASDLSLNPLGAGDLIDRSVRVYRRHFWTFVWIASPPVLLGTVFFAVWMYVAGTLFSVNSSNPMESVLYNVFIWLGSLLIWLIQLVAILVVMGGASRNFVRYTLFGESISFRATYNNVRSRLTALLSVSTLLAFFLGVVFFVVSYAGVIVMVMGVAAMALLFSSIPILAFIASLAVILGAIVGILWLFFLVASRFVYVPQVMLVEGLGPFKAISRSASLAGKNVRRVAALSIFTLVATYSALSLFYIPLTFYAWVQGVDFFSFDAVDTIPAWYEISSQAIFQGSLILIIPVLMIGLCLLYIDERVNREGYDIELMAAARLGEIPAVPVEFVNPLQPAISGKGKTGQDQPADRPSGRNSLTTLGLK